MLLPAPLESLASLYVSGAMTAPERDAFELILECHAPLSAHVAALQEAGTALLCTRLRADSPAPDPAQKAHLFASLKNHPHSAALHPAIVVTDPSGGVEYINPAFISMCGYTLDELRGRKPGSILQGPLTDPAAVARMRAALTAHRPCREVLVNYHKEGWPYRVDLAITPVFDDSDSPPVYFVARETDLGRLEPAAA